MRTDLNPGLVLFVSISQTDFALDNLVTLGCKFGLEHASERFLWVHFFDSDHAARFYNPQGEGNDAETVRAQHATYGFIRDEKNGNQALEWFRSPVDTGKVVHVDIGPPPPIP